MATTAGDPVGEPKKVRRTAPRRKAAVEPAATADFSVVMRPEPTPAVRNPFSADGVRYSDVTTFLRQLIMLLEAGTSILKALRALSQRGERPAMRALVAEITASVEAGNPLWMAFDHHPLHFDTVFVNLIKASEASGTLTTVLRRLVDYREERELLRKRVRGAMVYPVLLLLALFGAMFVITSFVVPVFADFFDRAGLNSPGPTRFLIYASAVFRVWWWLPIVAFVALVVAYKFWYVRNPVRRITADRVKLRIPILGPIFHKNAIVEMSRTLGLLLRSGLSMMATLDLTRNAIHNRAVAESLQAMRNSVERGGGLEEPMRQSDVIPSVVADMFVTGEESGRVDDVAEQIAGVYEQEVRIAVESVGEAIQPIFTLFVGVFVLILFVSLFLPMIHMLDQLGSQTLGG